jgi:hypothetical protein
MEHSIRCADSSAINVSEYDDGVWLTVHKIGAHTGIPITRAQALELRDALNTLLEITDAAQ